jgi:hypothetical protein
MSDTVSKDVIKSGINIMKSSVALEGIAAVFSDDMAKAEYATHIVQMMDAFLTDLDAM